MYKIIHLGGVVGVSKSIQNAEEGGYLNAA